MSTKQGKGEGGEETGDKRKGRGKKQGRERVVD